MNRTKQIIGFLLILALTMQMNVPLSYAISEAEQTCQKKKPNYVELMKVWSEAKTKDQKAYTSAFEAAQSAHHNYVGCIFDFAERTVLKSDGAEDSGTIDANTLNTGGIPIFSTLVDWMSPDQACLTPDELKKIIKKSDPSQLLAPILQAHSDYRNHLTALGNQFDGGGLITDDQGKALSAYEMLNAKSANLGTVKRQRALEIQSSLLAIDLMFTSLKELRLSFVMHVQFQCTLKFLEQYRKALADLRLVVESLPSLLKDASISK